MTKRVLFAAFGCALAACTPAAAPGGEGAANNDPAAAAPTYSYKCGDASYKLVLDFDKLEATRDGGEPVTLRALFPMNADGVATYTDGKTSFFVKSGAKQPDVSFARGRMAATPCAPG